MQVVVESLLVHYEVSGKGKAVVCLHGWGDSQQTWRSLAKQLSNSYKVITLDLPGFGLSQRPPRAWGLEEYSYLISAFLKKMSINKVEAFIGHSNGGAIAIYGVGSGVLQSNKLVLIASSGVRDELKSQKSILKYFTKIAKAVSYPLSDNVKRKLQRKYYRHIGSDALVIPEMRDTFEKIVRQDVKEQARNIKQETILIYGDGDKSTPMRFGQVFQSYIKKSKLIVIKNAKHFVHIDQPQKVENYIEAFLNNG